MYKATIWDLRTGKLLNTEKKMYKPLQRLCGPTLNQSSWRQKRVEEVKEQTE
jgi:hypothetical protein